MQWRSKMQKLDRYLQIEKKVEAAQQEADQAEGAISELMKQLKKDFGCSSLSEAKRERKKLKKQAEESKAAFEKALDDFEEKWSDESD